MSSNSTSSPVSCVWAGLSFTHQAQTTTTSSKFSLSTIGTNTNSYLMFPTPILDQTSVLTHLELLCVRNPSEESKWLADLQFYASMDNKDIRRRLTDVPDYDPTYCSSPSLTQYFQTTSDSWSVPLRHSTPRRDRSMTLHLAVAAGLPPFNYRPVP